MKLHLPKGLRSAVLACMAVVGGFATTVGTGVMTGGAITIAFSTPQAYADYSWKGGTGDKTAADWNKADNWELNGATFAGSGPGTPDSNMWANITVSDVNIGSATDYSLLLEGWSFNFTFSNSQFYAQIKKLQSPENPASISATNGSNVNLQISTNNFNYVGSHTYTIDATSSLTFDFGGNAPGNNNNASTVVNLSKGGSLTYKANQARSLGTSTLVKTSLGAVTEGTWGTQALGLTLQNVTLNNLSFDLGEGWELTDKEITAENYGMLGGKYNIVVDETGAYSVVYSTAAPLVACEWGGGALTWGVGADFSNSVKFANGADVAFTTADADVTLAADVYSPHITVADGIKVSISGDNKVSADSVQIGAGATFCLGTVGNDITNISLGTMATLSLAPGKAATLTEMLGSAAITGAATGIIEITGVGTELSGVGNAFNGYSVVSVSEGAKLNVDGVGWGQAGKNIFVAGAGSVIERTTGDDVFGWSSAQNISILNEGKLDLGGTRATMDTNDVINIEKGTLAGTSTDYRGSLDYYQGGGVINASNGSVISGSIGGQKADNALTFNVTADATDGTAGLTVSGELKHNLSFKKTGTGTMVLTAANSYNGTATVEEGTLAIKGADAIGKNLTVLDGATLVLDGAVTLAGTNHLAGILSMTDTVTLNGALTLGDTAEIDLSDWVGGDTYQLFNLGEGASITPATVKVAGREGSWLLNIDGALVESADLHWLGGDLTWNADTEFEGGKLIPTSVVTFNGDAGDVKATVEGTLATTILAVEEGTNLVLSGTGTLSTVETRVEGEMTVGTTGNSLGVVVMGSEGALTIATGGTTTLADSIGTTNITGGTLGVATGTTLEVADGSLNNQKMDIAGELVISDCSLGADINISGKVTLNQGDGINYGANNTITIDGGELALGANRQTFGANNKLVLHDGTVTGTGDQHGAVDFYQDGGKITSTGTSSIEAPVRLRGSGQTTTMDVQDGTLTVSTVCHTGGGSYGDLSKIGAGTLAISGSLDTTGAVKINEGVLKMLNGSSATSAITLAGGSLAAEGTATMASLAGSGDITVAADGTLTITNVVSSGSLTKKGAGTLAIGTLTGNFVSMNHEGTQTVGTYALAENAVLSYGKTGNLLKIDALTTAVAVDIFDIDISSGVELNLGIASSVSKDLISVIGLESYELVDDNGYWKLTSAATALETDWDFNWGSAGLAGAPTSLETVAVAGDATELFLNGSPATLTGGNGNVIVYGGTKLNNGNGEAAYDGNVWIQATEGQYKAIVGGHWANTWGSGTIAHFNGDTHIIVDGATVGTVIGGTLQDGRGPVFTGNSYISIFSGDVTAAVVGAGTNAHGGTTTFTGNTNIFVYVPLVTNNQNNIDQTTGPGDAIIGGGIKADNQNRNSTNIVNGSTNVTIDLSEYTGTGDKFAKKVIGGHFNWNGNLTANINGDTNVTVIGKSGITFTDVIVGGSRVNQGSISTTGTSSVNISGGSTFSSVVAAGSYLSGVLTSTVGNTVLDITGGTYNGNLTGGSYVDAEGAVSRQDNSTLTVSGGTFSGNIAGASYLGKRATSTSGTSTVTIADAAFTGWVTGGVFTNSGSSVVTIGDVNMSLSDSSFSKLVTGGTFVGGNSTTNAIGDVNIVLDGVTLTEGLYGGVYHYGNSNASTSTVGDVTITLTGDGTISGNIWAAGGIRGANANITVESTTVKVADTVAFADGVTLNAGFDKAATDSCVVAVTGDRSLIFTGNADQDRSTLAFAGFNKIGVETAGKTATIGALTATEAITIDGKGTIKLGGAATLTGGATVEGALDMNGQSVTGDVTVEGTLTSKGTSVAGTLTIGNAATLTDATAATNIVVDSYSNTKGLTATESITVGTKLTSSAALTAGKITGEGSVEITGGTVTLSDTTDAFANAGTTSIAGADLAGTWAADDVTIGEGVTVSGTISLANSTINSTITSTGSVALSGDVTVGVAGVEGSAYYTHDGSSSETGNGFKSASTTYDLVDGTSDVTAVDSWLIGGTAATNTSYTDGVLTVQTNADPATYWVNTGTVSYDGAAATYGDDEQSLADTTSIMLNGGTLKLTSGSVADGYISASTTSGTLDVNGQSITQAVFGTLDGTVELSGAGSYALGTGVTALATNVALGDGWTGTVKMSDVTLTNDAYSAFAATNLEVTTATISNQLVMNGGSLTLGGAITADMAGLADVTLESIAWSTGNEGTGFSTTSREVQLVDVDGTVSVADGTTWSAMEGTTATFNSTTGKLTVADNAWTTEFYISSDDVVDYSATDSAFTNADGKAATSLCMMGGTLNLNSALADTMTDGIEVIGTGNAISINGTDVALAKGSLNVLSGDVALSGNGIYDLSASAANTELGTGVSLAAGWTGTVKTGDFTSTGAVDITALGNGSSTVLAGAVSVGSLTGTSVNMTANSVALTTGASTLGTLTTGALTLGGAEAATLAVGTLNLGDAGTLTLGNLGTGSLFSIGTLEGSFDLNISHDVLATVGDKNTIVLGTLTGDKDATMTFNGTELVDGSWIYEAEGYLFTLGWDGDNLTISSKLLGSTWQGGEDDVWSEDSSWANGVTPDEENAALFQGEGNSTVTIEGTVTPGDVTIEIADGSANAEDGYTFVGGEIDSSGALNVISGQLTIENEANTFVGDSQVAGNGELVVGSEATFENNLENSGTITMDGGTLTVEGNLVNNGTLDLVDGTGTLTVGGQLTGTKSDLSGIGTDMTVELLGGYSDNTGLDVDGRLVVGGDSSITGLTGDGSVGVAEDGTLTLGSDTTIAVKDSEGTIDATGHKLTLGTGSDNTGDLMADTLNVGSAQGVVAGTITAKEIQFGTVEPGKDAVLNISDYTGEDILVTLDNAAADLATGRYHLISSDRAVDADDFSIADDYNQGVLMAGNIIELGTASAEGVATFGLGGDLYADVRVQTDEESTWFTSDSDSVAGQYITDTTDDSKLVYGYKTLDAIKHIVVDEDQTIDLSALTPDDENDSLMLRDVTGEGTLTLKGNGDDVATIVGGDLTGALDLQNITAVAEAPLTVGTMTGDADSTIGGTYEVTNSIDYTGSYAAATVKLEGATANLKAGEGLTVAGSKGTATLAYDSEATIDGFATTGADIVLGGTPTSTLTLTNASSMKGGSLSMDVDPAELGEQRIAGSLALSGTQVNVAQKGNTIQANGANVIDDVTSGVNVIASIGATADSTAQVTLTGKGFDKYFANARVEGGDIVADRNASYATDMINLSTENGAAGAQLLDNLLVELNPQAESPDSQMAKLLTEVDNGSMSDEEAAALAGSSISALGLALSGDVERQLRSIRNRTTTMGVNECVVNEGMPYFNAWFNTESNRTKLDADSTNPGYTLDSWGGTVGFDVDVNPNFTMGLAISAMYGSITAEGPDSLDGDMDTYYLSLFARYADCAWTHTFVATLGKMDGSYSRTIPGDPRKPSWGATDASIDGTSFGLMYEVGYVIPLDEDGEACVQPIFNVMLRHSSVGSFVEDGVNGTEVALDVDKQTMTTLTFGLGARMQAVVGESVYNRASIFEGRILAKADLGDRQSEADVAFVNGGSHKATVKSAELGTIGLELGAGLTIPLGDDDGSLFFDASVELRSGYTDVNGTVGYRINF